MRRQAILSTLLFSSVTITGCVTQPKDVKANLPLVNPVVTQHNSGKMPDSDLSEARAIPELQIVPNQPIIINGHEYAVSDGYISALGVECYRLKRIGHSGSSEIRPVCNNQNYWLLYPALVISDTL